MLLQNQPDAPGATLPEEGRTLQARVDLGQLARNFAALRRVSGGQGLIAVVKADAYGHGAVPVARTLEAQGIEGFCVATLAEGLALRAGGVQGPVQILGSTRPEALPQVAAQRLDLTLVSVDHLRELAPRVKDLPVGLHLNLDTGMGRSGVPLRDLGACPDLLRSLGSRFKGVMSHFSDSEDPSGQSPSLQRVRFREALAQLRDAGLVPAWTHQGNSAALLRGLAKEDTHARIGLALYGLCEVPQAREAGLRPILELSAEVMRVARLAPGDTVGYGSTYAAPCAQLLATVNCGYADGYRRALGNRARAGFRGASYPVVGRVSMDALTVALPEDTAIQPGDRMTLLGRDPAEPFSVGEIARLLDTIPYEITCALHGRVQRIYI